jgi:hypothetical protein
MGATVPQSVCKLLEALERIEKAFPTEKECKGPKANTNRGGSSKKKIVTFSNQTPKKSHRDAKHCVLCKQHGGVYNTHNTEEYRKYEKDGTPKKTFTEKNTQRNPRNRNASCEHNNCYVQLSAKIAKLENRIRYSSMQTKSTSAIVTVTVMTLTHHEVMGPVA